MKGIKKLTSALHYIRKEINEEIPVQQILLLTLVAENEGVTQHQLSIDIGMPNGTVSRNIKTLSQYLDKSGPGPVKLKGYDLLESRRDLADRHRMAVYLTSKGKHVMRAMDALMGDGR